MNNLKLMVCLVGVSLTQGCTVLGLAGDLALQATVDDLNEGKRRQDPDYVDTMYFTKIGFEQDAKIVHGLLKDVANAKQAELVAAEQDIRVFPGDYANKELCKQANAEVGECHNADYYQQFYIKNDAEQSVPVAQISDK